MKKVQKNFGNSKIVRNFAKHFGKTKAAENIEIFAIDKETVQESLNNE
ncbi:MAG: hypothetical protein HDR49_06985 [Bacteroides sp.]|nr:hypothetical protein [Bacteroides sp.]